MSEQEAVAYIEEWDVTEAAKVLKWYEEEELLRPCDCDTMVAIETEDLRAENARLHEYVTKLEQANIALDSDNTELRNDMKDMQMIVRDNHNLRELVADMYRCSDPCNDCPHYNGSNSGYYCELGIGWKARRMRELGVDA